MNSPIQLPNFFILGAAKCGTTSLHSILGQHPDVFQSSVKETCFFCKEFQVVDNPVTYVEQFASAAGKRVVGEASHVYMTNPASARTLQAFFPHARFVLILRNPADRAYSLYHHMRRHGFETISSFEKALEIEETRFASKKFWERCNQYPYNFFYFRSGLFGEQIHRFLQYFDSSRFHFLTLRYLSTKPEQALREICDFLGIDSGYAFKVERSHVGRTTSRIPMLQNFLDIRLRRLPGIRRRLAALLTPWNQIPIPPIARQTREHLMLRFRDDARKTAAITGLQLLDMQEGGPSS